MALVHSFDLGQLRCHAIEAGLADGSLHPNEQKRGMARAIVDLYHGAGSGVDAEERFDQVHKEHELPDDVPERPIPAESLRDGKAWLPKVMVGTGLATSNGEARRAVQQGGVRLDGVALDDPEAEFEPETLRGKVLQVGRRRFVRLT